MKPAGKLLAVAILAGASYPGLYAFLSARGWYALEADPILGMREAWCPATMCDRRMNIGPPYAPRGLLAAIYRPLITLDREFCHPNREPWPWRHWLARA